VMVKDIYSGSSSGIGTPYFTAVGNTLYFRADDGTNGDELWKSDGTTAGTMLIDLNAGPPDSNPNNLVVIGNDLYFEAYHTQFGDEIWMIQTDGTDITTSNKITYD